MIAQIPLTLSCHPSRLFISPVRSSRLHPVSTQSLCTYLDPARELKKKRWNMKVTVIPIVIGALSTVTKGLVPGLGYLEIRERVETIQTTALLRSARILRRVLGTYRDLLLLKLHWKINQHWCIHWRTLLMSSS